MSQEVKEIAVEDEDLKRITELRDNFAKVSIEIGQIEVEAIMVDERSKSIANRRTELRQSYLDLLKQESEMVNLLSEKYGDGSINLETGKFQKV